MPTPSTIPVGAPCWADLMTSDLPRSIAFYGELLGWTAEEPAEEFGGYVNFRKDGARVAGCMARPDETSAPDQWSVYLASDDAAKTVDTCWANGGQVQVPASPVGDLGVMAVLTDAGSASVGVWQPGTHPGFGLLGEPGAPAWFELHTRDYAATLAFYRDVFRWDIATASETPEFRYATMTYGGESFAGIMDDTVLAESTAPHWVVYFGVEDTDAALATVAALGGSVVMPAEDSPYGRIAAATDPTGAQFKLVSVA